MNILVTGSNGQVGSELQTLSKNIDAHFFFFDKEKLDITNEEDVLHFFKNNKIDYCINCAAYTAVDKAETDKDLALAINVLGPLYLAKAAQSTNATLIHISSDYVYHNEENRPMLETDETTPKGIYAATKLEGDHSVLENNSQSIVIRTSWVYSSFGNNFVKSMIRLGTERDQLNIVYDQIGTPTYARDIAKTIYHIISECEKGNKQYGIFNFSNEGVCSWYDFALAIFEAKNITCNVIPILSVDYPTPAARPHYSVLDKSKIKKTYQLTIPFWKDSLLDCLNLLND